MTAPRIVAGAAKGRRLGVPPAGTRPTSARAREALFNTLRAHLDLDGTRVLDLYAGTGALGLEALSRGAASAVFVESDRAAVEVLRANVAAVGAPGATVRQRTVAGFLRTPGPAVDLALLDPPYDVTEADLGAVLGALVDHLADGALVVVERGARSPEPAWPTGIVLVTERRYGEARLWYGRARSVPER